MQLGMVCMNGGAAMPSLKLWGQGLPRKAHTPGHVMPSKPASSHVNLAVLLANRGQQGPDGGCPAVLQGLVWVIGDASGWDRTGILVNTLQMAWYLKDKPWTLCLRPRRVLQRTPVGQLRLYYILPQNCLLSPTSVNIYGVR